MNKVRIRKAVAEDCAAMMLLIRELAAYENAPEEVTVTTDDFAAAGFGPGAIWQAFVAVLDDVVIGMCLFYPRYSTWKGRKLYIEDIVVTASCRGQGVGKLLFDATIHYAREEGYHSLYWQVLDWNEPALNFYRKYRAEFDDSWLNVSLAMV